MGAPLSIRGTVRGPTSYAFTEDRSRVFAIPGGAAVTVTTESPAGKTFPWHVARPEDGLLAYVVLDDGRRGWLAPDRVMINVLPEGA